MTPSGSLGIVPTVPPETHSQIASFIWSIAEICRDKDGQPEPDSDLRDSETVPLKEGIEADIKKLESEILAMLKDVTA